MKQSTQSSIEVKFQIFMVYLTNIIENSISKIRTLNQNYFASNNKENETYANLFSFILHYG